MAFHPPGLFWMAVAFVLRHSEAAPCPFISSESLFSGEFDAGGGGGEGLIGKHLVERSKVREAADGGFLELVLLSSEPISLTLLLL